MRARRVMAMAGALLLVTAGCGGGGDDVTTRRVLVDHSSDEFATFALLNFPEKVTARQGDAVEFKQTWTGEPHTVTGGTSVTQALRDGIPLLDFFESFEQMLESGVELPNPDEPGDATVGEFAKAFRGAEDEELRNKGVKAYETLVAAFGLPPLDESSSMPFAELVATVDEKAEEFFSALPPAFNDDEELAQNVGQPCYLDEGSPPDDPEEPCDEDDQVQPRFDGRQSYYNSGVIPYEGEGGNTFTVRIADDAELGTFLFYCAIHGAFQQTAVEIVEAGADIPSQGEVNREIRDATNEITTELDRIYEDATEDLAVELPRSDGPIKGPFAGLPGTSHSTAINEFIPKEMTVKAGEPITWKMMGPFHTISFSVPKYFPIMEFLDDGTVRINPKLQPVAGGAVEFVEPEGPPGGGDGGGGGGPPKHDGGTYDGTGFWSSGLIGAQPYLEYTMRISKPGTYNYACLIHPPMVGRIKVT